MNEKLSVSFFTAGGLKLSGALTLPGAFSGRKWPAILLCQGLSGVKDLVLPRVAERLAEAGFASLAFDYRGYGESEGERGWVLPSDRREDALLALAYLLGREEIDVRRAGIYGLSYGGPLAISVAARDPRIRCVVSVSGPGNGERFMRDLRTEKEWGEFTEKILEDRRQRALTGISPLVPLPEIVPFSAQFLAKYGALKPQEESSAMEKSKPGLKPRFHFASADAMLHYHPEKDAQLLEVPTLLVRGKLDDVAGMEQVKEIYDNLPSAKKLILLPGLDHVDLDSGEGLETQIGLSLQWFSDHLQGGDSVESQV